MIALFDYISQDESGYTKLQTYNTPLVIYMKNPTEYRFITGRKQIVDITAIILSAKSTWGACNSNGRSAALTRHCKQSVPQ